jgi:hypothetical protein
MKNKNMVLFFILSMILLGAYYLLTNRLNPPAPAPQVAAQAPSPASAAPAAASAPTAAPSVVSAPLFTKVFNDLKLTWRTNDGALVQAVWNQDGTRFFNEEAKDKNGKTLSLPFLGIGGAFEPLFSGDPLVAQGTGGQTVTFSSAAGDKLVYEVPDKGHVLSVAWTSSKPLALVRMPAESAQVHNLSRVFTLEEKKIDAVVWTKMLNDPWVGKRKELPAAASRVGLDAGVLSAEAA